VTAFVYEWERYLEGKVQILGISIDPPEEGKKLLERVTRDCQEDRPQIPLDPYPLRLLTDPDAQVIRAVGTANEGHWAGTIAVPSRRPGAATFNGCDIGRRATLPVIAGQCWILPA